MVSVVVRRLFGSVVSLWTVVTIVFFALRLLPGDPSEAALSQSTAPPEVLEQRRRALGLERPIFEQYISYLSGLGQGKWGISWSTGQTVEILVLSQLLPTVTLASTSMAIAIVIGLILGYGSAAYPAQAVGMVSKLFIAAALSTPVMLSGFLLIWLFSLQLDWLPATGQGTALSLILPSIALGFSTAGAIGQAIAAAVQNTLSQPYMLAARAKGLSFSQSVMRHGLGVALPPVLSIIAIQFGYLAAGAVVTEGVFARQGIGRLLLHSVLNKDLPVVQAIVILTASIYIVLNLLADLFHMIGDPRVRHT